MHQTLSGKCMVFPDHCGSDGHIKRGLEDLGRQGDTQLVVQVPFEGECRCPVSHMELLQSSKSSTMRGFASLNMTREECAVWWNNKENEWSTGNQCVP